jgi:DNA-binding beta-propeller fold protein YncE
LNTSNTYKPRVLFGVALALAGAGCGFGESGIAPPSDRIFFPAGMAVDPGGDWLYVVNSNSDLRFNAGTVVAVDLAKAKTDRKAAKDNGGAGFVPRLGGCANSTFVQPQKGDPTFCCRDFVDPNVLVCDERRYVNSAATVRIGSFGGGVVVQPFNKADPASDPRRRLFVVVRAEPSITFIDTTVTAGTPGSSGKVSMRCTTGPGGDDPFCTDDFRIRSVKQADGTIVKQSDGAELTLQEEPHPLLLDEETDLLYVGHLGGVERGKIVPRGVSVIDVCGAGTAGDPKPHLVSILQDALPHTGAIGVTSLVRTSVNGDPVLMATSELTSDIAELVFTDPSQTRAACGAPARTPRLAAGRRFASPAFATHSADLRGLVLDETGERAWVLHRQYAVRGVFNPPAVVAIDRRPDEYGLPLNQPIGLVEVCNGPNRMVRHDAGRGDRLFVNCFENGQIYVVDPDLMVVEAIIEVGTGPVDFVFAPNERSVAYVAGFANNNVSVVDLEPGSLTEYRVVQRIGFPRPTAVPK